MVPSRKASTWPEARKHHPRRPTALDPFKPAIDEMLWTDVDAPRKQRHTGAASGEGRPRR
jgi:hypothetical protein